MIKKYSLLYSALFFSSFFINSTASAGLVKDVPAKWRVESYGEKGVNLWFTPSTCANGMLTLPPTATIVDHNRLYATIMAAKLADRVVFIYYDETQPGCPISSYGMDAD